MHAMPNSGKMCGKNVKMRNQTSKKSTSRPARGLPVSCVVKSWFSWRDDATVGTTTVSFDISSFVLRGVSYGPSRMCVSVRQRTDRYRPVKLLYTI
jgi:hypothetical protein